MMRSIDFLTQSDAEKLPGSDPLLIVSVTVPGTFPARLRIPEQRICRLQLNDADVVDAL